MPQRIHTNQEMNENKEAQQDLSSLLPFLFNNPYSMLQEFAYGEDDRKKLKDIWLSSDSDENDIMTVQASIAQQDLAQLQQRGLISYVDSLGKKVQFTDEGKNLLKESILSDEETSYSFTKKASRELFSQNSYDFGNEVLIKIKNPEKYDTRYVAISKDKYKKSSKDRGKPQVIENYDIETRNEDGSSKNISQYSEKDLIKVLHLSKNIIDNHQSVRLANNTIISVPVHRIKSFSEMIMRELNSR